jgi:hypothetical protein
MEIRDRKRVIFFARIGLILGTIAFIFWYIGGRVSAKASEKFEGMAVQTQGPTPEKLAPGDLQIISTDGNIDVTLQGDKLLAGLSQATVEKVKAEMEKETGKESGLGAVIAGAAKSAVASAIGIHVSYPLANVRELRYVDNTLELVDVKGDTKRLGDEKTDDGKKQARFSKEDADRLIAAVNARKRELGIP